MSVNQEYHLKNSNTYNIIQEQFMNIVFGSSFNFDKIGKYGEKTALLSAVTQLRSMDCEFAQITETPDTFILRTDEDIVFREAHEELVYEIPEINISFDDLFPRLLVRHIDELAKRTLNEEKNLKIMKIYD